MNKFKECNQCLHEFNDKNLEPCKDCVPKKKTNADRIREMSDEELAIMLMCPAEYDESFNKNKDCNGEMNKNCKECTLKWLQSEAE